LHRKEHGTWLGITKQGRLACLTNFCEESPRIEGRSRGATVNSYLRTDPNSKETSGHIAQRLLADGMDGMGGFSLIMGRLRKPEWKAGDEDRPEEKNEAWEGLVIISNRSQDIDDVKWICARQGEIHALSNAHYGDMSWPKVVAAERLVQAAVAESAKLKEDTDALLKRLLGVMSHDTLPIRRDGEEWHEYLNNLRHSIYIPGIGETYESEILGHENHEVKKENAVLGNRTPPPDEYSVHQEPVSLEHGKAKAAPAYGTQKQTIILVDWNGHVTYLERTLFNEAGETVEMGKGDRKFEFDVEGW
jgi:uncharacterized protein with NRDE domain